MIFELVVLDRLLMGLKNSKPSRLSSKGVNTDEISKKKSSSQHDEDRIVENFIVIWLDSNINQSDEDTQKSITHLRRIVHTIKTFTDTKHCIDYLSEVHDVKVFLIISGSLSQQVVPRISENIQIISIYVFCNDKSKYEDWARHNEKIKGVFTEIEPLCDELKHDVRQSEINSIPISVVSSSSTINLNELDPSFMYSQLLKEIILENEYDDGDKKELVHFCRHHYANKNEEIEVISKFEQDYPHPSPIWWYTRQSGIFLMLNKALRTQDVEVIIKMGFFVRDLHQHIEQLYSETKNLATLTVYRGQGMFNAEFEKIKKSEGGLLSFNNFLSTSMDQDVSLKFAHNNLGKPDMTAILFRMKINRLISTTAFASLDQVSYYRKEKEILFSMHTVFRIGEIKQIKERVWRIDLKLTSDNDQQLTLLTQHIRESTRGPTGLHRMAQLLIKMGEFDKAEEIYTTLLKITSDDNRERLAHAHHQLGLINDMKGDPTRALSYYHQSLRIYLSYMSPIDPSLSPTYSNIGAVYKQKKDFQNALEQFRCALKTDLNAPQPDQRRIAIDHNNIGSVFKDQDNFQEALVSYERALKIELVLLPSTDPSLAITYNNIAGVYYAMKDNSRALSYYQNALFIQEKSLPWNHPERAITHNNMANTLDGLDRTKEAIEHAKQAVYIGENVPSPIHEQKQRYEQNLKKLTER